MLVTRFYTTEEGGSAFDEIEIPFDREIEDGHGNTIRLSNAFDSANVRFLTMPVGLEQDWHVAPARQLVMVLEGRWEVCTTDGGCCAWGPGEVFMPYDVDGRGHTARVLEGPVRLLFVPLPEGFDLQTWSA